jgi:hypothetical protein
MTKANMEFKTCWGCTIHQNVLDYQWVDGQYQNIILRQANQGAGGQCAPDMDSVVNTSGAVVTKVSGDFPYIGEPETGVGDQVTITGDTGSPRTVSTWDSATQLTLTATPSCDPCNSAAMAYGETGCKANYFKTQFTSNLMRNGPLCMVWGPDQNIQYDTMGPSSFSNNLCYKTDRTQWANDTGGYVNARYWWTFGNWIPNTEISHNAAFGYTATQTNGDLGGMSIDEWGAVSHKGVLTDGVIKNNIWTKSPTRGVVGNGCGADEGACIDRHVCNGGTCSATNFDKNLMVGVDLTNHDRGTNYNLCEVSTGCSVNIDLDHSVNGKLYVNFDEELFVIRDGHPLQRGGTDGRDLGPDFNSLPKIKHFEVVPLDDKALFTWELTPAILDTPCVIHISTARDMSSTISDLDPDTYTNPESDRGNGFVVDGQRRMFIAGLNAALTPSTTYYYQLAAAITLVRRRLRLRLR